MLSLAQKGKCVVWVAPAITGEHAAGSEHSAKIIEHVRAAAPKVHILDWPADIAGHDDVFVGDGVHQTASGQLRFADAIVRQGVKGMCGFGA